MLKPPEYYVMKGMVTEMPKEDQEKIENMKKEILMIVERDTDTASIALGLASMEFMDNLEL